MRIERLGKYGDTSWWRGRISDRINRPFQWHVYPGREGIAVMDEDWDNLIILDACRYDLFEEVADLSKFDEYRRVKSLGSSTPEWTKRNFSGKRFGDTVYVSGNPFTTKFAGDSFYRLYEVWDDLDDETETVLPSIVVSKAKEAAETHEDKRLIAHFMQPHHPFVSAVHWDDSLSPENAFANDSNFETPWTWLREGKVTYEEVWANYRANLEYVLDDAIELAESLPGKSVISSDHGNLVGERDFPVPIRRYGHPPGLRKAELVTVSWAVIDGPRRKITEGDAGGSQLTDSDEALIEERLADLGYHE